MSKKDGKVYIILYNVCGYEFHQPYIYKTLDGAIDAVNRLKSTEWYMKNFKLIVASEHGSQDDGQYYIVDQGGEYSLIPVTEETRILYG